MRSVSARVNDETLDNFNSEIPLSRVIEAGIIHFNELSEEEKVVFMLKNSPQTKDIIKELGETPEEIKEMALEEVIEKMKDPVFINKLVVKLLQKGV